MKRFVIILFCFVLIFSYSDIRVCAKKTEEQKTEAKKEEKKTTEEKKSDSKASPSKTVYFVGDSRMLGMAHTEKGYNNAQDIPKVKADKNGAGGYGWSDDKYRWYFGYVGGNITWKEYTKEVKGDGIRNWGDVVIKKMPKKPSVKDTKIEVVYMLGANNGKSTGINDCTAVKNISALKRVDHVYVVSCLQFKSDASNAELFDKDGWNTRLKNYCTGDATKIENVSYLDIYNDSDWKDKYLASHKNSAWATDGVHFTSEAYKVIFDCIMKTVDPGQCSAKAVADGSGAKKAGISNEELAKRSGMELENIEKISGYVTIWRVLGYSDAAITGLLNNARQESMWDATCGFHNADDGGYGLFQMTNGDTLKAFAKSDEMQKCTHEKAVPIATECGITTPLCKDGACCIAFLFGTDKGVAKDFKSSGYNGDGYLKKRNALLSKSSWQKVEGYNGKNYAIRTKIAAGDTKTIPYVEKVPLVKSLDEFKALTDAHAATDVFNIVYERSDGALYSVQYEGHLGDKSRLHYMQGFMFDGTRHDMTENFLLWLGGSDGGGGASVENLTAENMSDTAKEAANELANTFARNGLFTAEQISNINRNLESVVDISASYTDLSSDELGSLYDWKYNRDKMNEKGSLLWVVRMISMLFGILLTLYSILMYIAYWFDRINNIIDFSLVEMLSFKKLRISDTEEKCTFRARDIKSTEVKTVNHRAIVFITLTGLVFGALIISGVLYTLLLKLVNMVFNAIGV